MTRKSRHYADAMGLYRALSAILSDRWELTMLQRYEPKEFEDRHRAEVLDSLREFRDWLGDTSGGQGLTAEKEAEFRARTDMGVNVKLEGGSVVIRVPGRSA